MDFTELTRLHGAFAASRILQTAVALGVFDALGAGASSSAVTAARLGTDARATMLLLNALVALEVLVKDGDTYDLTPAAREFLTANSPRSLQGMIRFDAALWAAWERLPEAVRSGNPVRRPDMFQSTPEETERFVRAMHSLVSARGDAERIAPLLGLDRVHRLLDIGAGPGTYAIAFCQRFPHVQATLFDLPATLAVTRHLVANATCHDRLHVVAGDFNRDPLPGGFDLVFLSNIIHGEDETANERLVRKVFAALHSGGRVVIKDHILDSTLTRPAVGALFSVQMLLFTRGRDYSFDEVSGWLQRAGFVDIGEQRLAPPLISTLVLATKP